MADEQIVTNIVATSDFSSLITDLNKITSSLTKLQAGLQATNKTLAAQAAVMNRNFADTLRSTGQFSTHFVSLTSDVDKFGSQLDKGQIKLKQFFNVYGQHAKTSGGLIRDLAKQQVMLQNAILQPLGKNAQGLMQYNVHIPAGLDAVKNKTALAKQELQILNKVIQEGAGQLINWGKNTQWAGRQLTVGLTVPLAAFGKAAADAFRQADAELTRLTKVYGGVAATSASDLSKIRNEVSATAKDLSKAYGSSYKDTIALAADIAATGKTGNELLGSLKETTRLSVLGEVDKQQAMKATLAIQTTFKQNTEELSDSINFLNAVENQTSTSLQDLTDAIPKAGTVIQAMGGGVKDLALYLTAMKEGGVSASEGANAIKSSLASLINPTNKAKDMFQSFGISLENIVSSNAGNITQTILDLQAALDKLNPLQKQQAIEQLFGKFQFARMNALFANLGKQGSQTLQVLDLMKSSTQDLANLAGRELTQVTESASGRYNRAVEGLRADLAQIGDQFLTINTHLINLIDGIVKFVNKLPDPLKKILGILGMFTAAAGPLIMLTGVLANFFGYVVKGISHMRALFKGGEGWKLLTPEILAAQKAGNLVEQTFYSDAQAAGILKQAIAGLALEFDNLSQKAMHAAEVTAVNPGVSTVAGNPIIGGRTVNPNNPYVGAIDTRAAGHHNPRSAMTQAERNAQTIHSFTPTSIPVNQKIGATPQIFSQGDLPDVPGLTNIKGVSTGIVAGEAAKWHALMATLSTRTEAEVAVLKKEIIATGQLSAEFMSTYSSVLPLMTQITDKAAADSLAIISELKANKINMDQARAQIIAVNKQLEASMISTTSQVAQDLGRTANLTAVPLTNQPIVSPTGKSNIKELFRSNRPQKGIMDKIARLLGVRTYGAGYSTETTIPKKMATGGIVPGVGNTDSYATTLPVGSFVVNKQATAANMDVLAPMMGFNQGGQVPVMLTPGEAVIDPATANANLGVLHAINGPGGAGSRYALGGYVASNIVNDILRVFGVSSRSQSPAKLLGNWGMLLPRGVNSGLAVGTVRGSELLKYTTDPSRQIDLERFLQHSGVQPKDIARSKARVAKRISESIDPKDSYSDATLGQLAFSVIDNDIKYLEKTYPGISLAYQKDRMQPGRRDTLRRRRPGETQAQANARGGGSPTGINVPGGRGSSYGSGRNGNVWAHFEDQAFNRNINAIGQSLGHLVGETNPAAKGPNPRDYSVTSHGRNTFLGMPLRRIGRGWSNPRYVGSNQVADALRFSWGRGRGYALGGQVGQVAGSMAGYTAGSALGSMIGGQTGSMIGGMAGSMLVPAMMSGIGKEAGTSARSLLNFRNAAQALVRLPGPVKLVAGLLAVGAAVKTVNDKINEHRKLINLGFAPTEESAARLGIKFKSLTSQMKDFAEQTKLNKASIEQFYAATQSSGVAGLNLTIKQLQDLKNSVKKDFPDYIKIFNAARPDEVIQKARQLKAQFIAGGMSAEKATQTIYGLVSVSNNANKSLSVMADKGFNSIKDSATAASSSLQTFAKLLSSGNTDQLTSGFDQLLNSVAAFERSLNGTKDSTGQILTSANILQQVFEKLNAKSFANQKIGQKMVDALVSQNSELNFVVSKTDTISGTYAKIKLYLSGMDVDLKSMTSEMAQQVALLNQQLNSEMAKTSKQGGMYGALVDQINTYKTASTNATKSATTGLQATQVKISDQIKIHQKLIQKIKDEADARVKALDAQQNAENTQLAIKKKQLEYQDALAAGNMSAAAQAQMDIQGLVSNKQHDDAVTAIRDKEAADTRKQQNIIDALQAKSDKASVTASNASKLADNAMAKATKLQTLLTDLTAATIAAQNGVTDTEGKNISNIATRLRDAAKEFKNPAFAATAEQIDINKKTGKYGLEKMSQDALKQALLADGSLSVTDKKLLEYMTKTKFGQTSIEPTTITTNPNNRYKATGQFVSGQELKAAGVKGINASKLNPQGTYVGTTFTDKNGNKFKVVGDAGYYGYSVVPLKSKGGLINPQINVPRAGYSTGGRVYLGGGGTASSISIDQVNFHFPETPSNGKQLYAEFKEQMRIDNLKMQAGGRRA